MKKALLLFVLLFMTLGLPASLYAQALDLTQTYTSPDGQLTLLYPRGWSVTLQNPPTLVNTATALTGSQGVTEMVEGDIAFSFLMPSFYEEMGVTGNSAASVLESFMADNQLTGPTIAYTALDIPAASASFTNIPNVIGAQIVTMEFDAGVLLVVIEFGNDPQDSAGIVADILSGVTFNGPAAEATSAPVAGEPIRQWASAASGTSQYGDSSWSFEQATGAPDTTECGDLSTAWASSSSTGRDTLTLDFAEAVIPTQINIYQTYNPGSIIQVLVGNSENPRQRLTGLPNSSDPPTNTPCPGVFTVDINTITEPVDRVSISLDQTIIGNWNEIDAVELVGIPVEAPAAEDVEMETLNFNGQFALSYPSSWVTDLSGPGPVLASVPEALELVNTDPLPVGAVRIEFALPDTIADQGLPTSGPIEDVVAAALALFRASNSSVVPLEGVDRPAVVSQLEGPGIPPDLMLIGIEMPTGPVLAAVRTADYARYEPVILQILNSIAMK